MKNNRIHKWMGYSLLVGTPAFCYLLFEWITGNLMSIQGEFILWNLLFYYIFYLLLFSLTNRMRFSYVFLNTIFTIWAIAEYYVVLFRSRPIMLWDFMAWRTAFTVADNYSYVIVPKIVIAVVLVFLWNILICIFPVHLKEWKVRIKLTAIVGTVSILWFYSFFGFLVANRHIDISMWNPIESYETNGYLVCTIRMFEYLRVKKPVNYNEQMLQQIEASIESLSAESEIQREDDAVIPTNIICIMNESWADLSVIAPFETDQPYLSYYHSLSENCVKGNLYVPVFGSMTSNTEYEFLTANSMAFAPEGSVPFQIYMREPTYSLPLLMKGLGYQTVAMHPYPGANWNRIQAYQAMGFDQFLDEEFFTDSPLLRGYVSDRGNFDKIISLTENKKEGSPLFIFNVTMQNHGGYEQDYQAAVHLKDYDGFNQTEQYLSLIRESDQALEYLLDYYKQIEEPTLIMMFGDHQPGVEEEFYEVLYQNSLSELDPDDYLRRFITPFFIWTNYSSGYEEVEGFSALYLSNMVLQKANLPMTDYRYFLEDLKKKVPIIHSLGYYDEKRARESWTNWREKKNYPELHQLELLQYHVMFDKKRILEHLFIIDISKGKE